MAIPEAHKEFRAHIRDLKAIIVGDPSGPSASNVIHCTLVLWQEAKYPALRNGARRPYGTATLFKRPAIVEFADWLSKIGEFNVAAYWLASAYAILVGEDVRSSRSLYFTPPTLAQRVIDGLLKCGADLTTQGWHDPACGGAAFLVPIAQRMQEELEKVGIPADAVLAHVEKNLSGTDLDHTLLTLSGEFLRMALYRQIEAADRLPRFDLTNGNGLTESPQRALNVVICNPPYKKLKASETEEYFDSFQEVIEGQPNIYGLFIKRSLEMAADNGLVGLLTPTSFLSGQYFSKLRRWLLENSHPRRIEMLSGRKSTFIDVEQETTIMLAQKIKKGSTRPANVKLAVRTENGVFEEIGQCRLPSGGRPWSIPKSVGDVRLVSVAAKSTKRLSSYGYRAKIGHLVDYRDTRQRMASKAEGTRSAGIFPLVWATDVSPIGVFQHGRSLKSKRANRFVQLDKESQGGVVRSPSVILQRVTSTDQTRRLVCAAVPADWMIEHGGFVAENHVIVIEKIQAESSRVTPELLASILGTETIDRLFRAISGASNVSIFELNEIPLPDPEVVVQALAIGSDIESAVIKGYANLALETPSA